jgi:hypothetical protein
MGQWPAVTYTETKVEESRRCGAANQPVQLTGKSGSIETILKVADRSIDHDPTACEPAALAPVSEAARVNAATHARQRHVHETRCADLFFILRGSMRTQPFARRSSGVCRGAAALGTRADIARRKQGDGVQNDGSAKECDVSGDVCLCAEEMLR